MELSIQKLGMAYRKAKVDLYYNSLPPLLRIAEYEANLPDHLESLRARLNGDDESWVTDEAFLGWLDADDEIDQPGQRQAR